MKHTQTFLCSLFPRAARPSVLLSSGILALFSTVHARGDASALERGLTELNKLSGCYVVDYSFVETEALKPDYTLDKRVYDVNIGKTVHELIIPISKSPTELRLQHVLFSTGTDGKVQFVMKHMAEDWAYEAPFLYDFVSPNNWNVRQLKPDSGFWTRKVTNLDDGLRYQCAAPWDFSKEQPVWSCDNNFAPIPGRETRDMGRKDYNTLDRSTRIVSYGSSHLERESNIKTIFADNTRTPLARELGKTWSVRQLDGTCSEAQAWATPRLAFWKILMEEWESVFAQAQPLRETPQGGTARYADINEIEERLYSQVANNPVVAETARTEIRAVLNRSLAPTPK